MFTNWNQLTFFTDDHRVAQLVLYSRISLWPPPPKSLAVNGQLIVTTLPDILFLNNSGVHNIAPQSAIWLYCTANSATATPSITWTKNGVTLVNDPPHIRIRIRSSNDTLLCTNSSLVVDNFGIADDDGSYVCQASDGTATVSSSTLSLTGRSCWFSTCREICVSIVYFILVNIDARKYQYYSVAITLCRCTEVIFLYTIAIKHGLDLVRHQCLASPQGEFQCWGVHSAGAFEAALFQ